MKIMNLSLQGFHLSSLNSYSLGQMFPYELSTQLSSSVCAKDQILQYGISVTILQKTT